PPDGSASISSELSALAISDQEAAEAGLEIAPEATAGAWDDKTPPQAFAPPHVEEEAVKPVSEPPAPAAAPPPAAAAPAPAAPAEKTCSNCGALNPPTAKFCFDCGTPFAKKAPAPSPSPVPASMAVVTPALPAPVQPAAEAPPSIHVDEELVQHLAAEESAAAPAASAVSAVSDDDFDISRPSEDLKATSEGDPLPMSLVEGEPPEIQETDTPGEAAVEHLEEQAAEHLEDTAEPAPVEAEPVAAELLEEPEEAPAAEPEPAPFGAGLVLEKSGTSFALPYLENAIGSGGGQVELADDPFVAPHAATLTFAGGHLVLRDDGSVNGVYLKVRESAPLEAGDSFIAGERLFRFDGPADLPRDPDGETPMLGSPRPAGSSVRISEVLAGGRTGRTCHRAGPVIAIGKAGCDLNFPADSLLSARHAEIRLAEDGTATLVDLGMGPSGVLLRVRAEARVQAGDIVQVGEQLLRVEVA
ncbi:MAG TPA: FHA domain-containing protein, partial [Myxococcales bacterium]|nr:FHA domain-containing protein [Myxococcales bacterium]